MALRSIKARLNWTFCGIHRSIRKKAFRKFLHRFALQIKLRIEHQTTNREALQISTQSQTVFVNSTKAIPILLTRQLFHWRLLTESMFVQLSWLILRLQQFKAPRITPCFRMWTQKISQTSHRHTKVSCLYSRMWNLKFKWTSHWLSNVSLKVNKLVEMVHLWQPQQSSLCQKIMESASFRRRVTTFVKGP